MTKDFFDEEYEKMEREKKDKEEQEANRREEQHRKAMDDWYSYQAPTDGDNGSGSASKKSAKPWYIVLLCLALVFAIALGWVLSSLFRKEDSREGIYSEVIRYLENYYYQEIPDDNWEEAVAKAGTAMMQSAGDQYSRLLTPQQYYDLVNQVSSSISASEDYFGISYSFVSSLGLYISSVVSDSSCYGLLQGGDIVLKLSDIEYYDNAYVVGSDVDKTVKEIVIADMDQDTFTEYMAVIRKATFHFIRNGEVQTPVTVTRGKVGLEKAQYNYQFIEFYFKISDKSVLTNISTTPQNNAQTDTYTLRELQNLPSGTGYVRITEFMYYVSGNSQVTAADEFASVMDIFKRNGLSRLVLDLKGNPGGSVDAVCKIAGMLVTSDNLTEAQKEKVTSVSDDLLITSLTDRNGSTTSEYVTSSYSEYFSTSSNGKCNIVVWTDENSASASELLTGALLDYKTAVQMGTKTYGKGIAQTYTTLPYTGKVTTVDGYTTTGNWGIYYTYAKYYSPLGTNIHGVGYTPSESYNNLESYSDLWNATLNYWGGSGTAV